MARKKSKEEREYDVLLANVRKVCETSYGRDFVWNILSACGIYTTTGAGDNRAHYNEGARAVGLHVMQLLDDADLSIYPRLLLEKRNINLEGKEDARRTDDTDYGTDGANIDSDTGTVPSAH